MRHNILSSPIAGRPEDIGALYSRDTITEPGWGQSVRPCTPRTLSKERPSTVQKSAPSSKPDMPRKPAMRQDKLRSLQQQRSTSRAALQSQQRSLGQENVPMQGEGAGSSGSKAAGGSRALADRHAGGMDEETLEQAMARACAVLRRSSTLSEATAMPAPAQYAASPKVITYICAAHSLSWGPRVAHPCHP